MGGRGRYKNSCAAQGALLDAGLQAIQKGETLLPALMPGLHIDVSGAGQNSGLGLSISRQIAEAHGGTLKADNILDKATGATVGARFTLALPAGPQK